MVIFSETRPMKRLRAVPLTAPKYRARWLASKVRYRLGRKGHGKVGELGVCKYLKACEDTYSGTPMDGIASYRALLLRIYIYLFWKGGGGGGGEVLLLGTFILPSTWWCLPGIYFAENASPYNFPFYSPFPRMASKPRWTKPCYRPDPR